MPRALLALATLGLIAMPGMAMAQAAMCHLPGQIERPTIERPSKAEPQRIAAIGGYTLALTWSPQYCATAPGGRRDAFQCGGRNGQFAFTLHGLWPDGVGKAWPQYCRAVDLLPRSVIRDNLCSTPSAQLLQHEWAKHGSCMASQPDLYFNLSRTLFQTLRFPDMAWRARQSALTVGAFAEAFARANKGMKANMIQVTTTRDNWLSEVWLCMDKAMEYARCPTRAGAASPAALLKIASGPIILNRPMVRPDGMTAARPAPPKPKRDAGAVKKASQHAQPPRRPALILNLDPKVQPLTNSAVP